MDTTLNNSEINSVHALKKKMKEPPALDVKAVGGVKGGCLGFSYGVFYFT